MSYKLSILIVNYNTSDFIDTSLFVLEKLTYYPYKVYIIDNGSKIKDYLHLEKVCQKYDNVFLQRESTDLRGSMAHGTALNKLVKMVDTSYFSILDSDATWLRKDWDKILIDIIDDKVKVIGTQAPEPKPQDFPLMFAILFETASFQKLNIDFRPKDQELLQDTGFELRQKYFEANLNGLNIELRNTRYYKNGPFKKLLGVGEYYWQDKLFASHFGRGSSMGLAKYTKGIGKIIYRIPIFGKWYLHRKGNKEKQQWLKICRKIAHQQTGPSQDQYETLEECPNCKSKKLKVILEAPDRLAGKSGLFYLSKCKNCTLVFQNPRIKEEYIAEYYTDNIGYCNAPVKEIKPTIKQKIKNSIKHKLPARFRNVYFDLDYIEGGKLLEIGCSNGQRLASYRDDGWDVKGLEMSEETAKYAREKRGLDVQTTRIEDIDFGKNSFDVIVLSMVLEHLYNPIDSLDKITKWLKPGGKLIFSIPYYEGFEFKLHKEYSYGLQLPTHITFFNKQILKNILTDLHYQNIRFDFDWFDRDLVAPWQYKYKDSQNPKHKFLAQNKILRLLVFKPFILLLSLLGRTSRVVVSATKK